MPELPEVETTIRGLNIIRKQIINKVLIHTKKLRFKIPNNISLMVVDIKTGEKADFGSKKTIIEAFKKNDKRNNEAINKINVNNFNFY